jgi:hypothetical protein
MPQFFMGKERNSIQKLTLGNDVGLPPGLRQTVKTLFSVRCKILDRQDYCSAI